jgi:hypothetical protein
MRKYRVVLLTDNEENQDWHDIVVEADSEKEARVAAEDSYPGFIADGVWEDND